MAHMYFCIFCIYRMLAQLKDGQLDINCCDPLGRSALLMAIDNENLEMVDLLLDNKVGKLTSMLKKCTALHNTTLWYPKVPILTMSVG